ncbi:hypothetical protein LSAT2_016942 [Lamellibrachia satsuma]|nr:hypothetical protein LSAT2_016942 [Lamellibrachia satsuma]
MTYRVLLLVREDLVCCALSFESSLVLHLGVAILLRFFTVVPIHRQQQGQFAFVKFQSPETVSTVLSPQFGPVYIGNCRLTIKLREY